MEIKKQRIYLKNILKVLFTNVRLKKKGQLGARIIIILVPLYK